MIWLARFAVLVAAITTLWFNGSYAASKATDIWQQSWRRVDCASPPPSRSKGESMTNIHPLREPFDFYPTPPEGTRALLSAEDFEGTVWEPACGDGAIARVLSRTGYKVVSTDLIDRGYGTGGVNFLAETEPRARNIITNPPYGRGLADAFIRHALALTRDTGGSVAMLLVLDGLAHPIRHALWVNNPPANIYVLDELVCQPGGQAGRITTPAARFCWVVWKSGHAGPPALWWLSTARFRPSP